MSLSSRSSPSGFPARNASAIASRTAPSPTPSRISPSTSRAITFASAGSHRLNSPNRASRLWDSLPSPAAAANLRSSASTAATVSRSRPSPKAASPRWPPNSKPAATAPISPSSASRSSTSSAVTFGPAARAIASRQRAGPTSSVRVSWAGKTRPSRNRVTVARSSSFSSVPPAAPSRSVTRRVVPMSAGSAASSSARSANAANSMRGIGDRSAKAPRYGSISAQMHRDRPRSPPRRVPIASTPPIGRRPFYRPESSTVP